MGPFLFNLLFKGETMKLNPIRDRILVRPIEEDTRTKSGIVIPDNAQEKPSRGFVVAAGTGRLLDNGTVVPLVVKAGDTVLYGKYAGTGVKLDNQEHIVMKEDDVLAIVE
jgi:chaperonin GroES